MTPGERSVDPLGTLVHAMLEGRIDADQRAQLAELLRADPSARARYIELVLMHSLLQRELGGMQQVTGDAAEAGQDLDDALEAAAHYASRPRPVGPPASRRRWVIAASAIAAAVLLALLVLPGLLRKASGPVVATIQSSSDAAGSGAGASRLAVGTELASGKLELTRGRIRIRFESGATATIDAPLRGELISPKEMRMDRGRVFLHVPRTARGFVIRMPEATVTDLGTELGLIAESGRSEVHVFEGRAEVVDLAGTKRTLDVGQAVVATRAGLNDTGWDANAFAEMFLRPQARISDTFVCNGASSDRVFGEEKRLVVKHDEADRLRYSYLKFDLSRIKGTIQSARLVMKVGDMFEGVPGSPEGDATHEAMLVSDVDWRADQLTWNTQPDAGAVVAQWKPRRGQTVEINLTEAAKSAQATGGAFAIRIVAQSRKGEPVWVEYISTRGPLADRPRLVLDISQ